MKTDLHPETAVTSIHCACGEEWETRSTKPEMRVDVCAKCHPFFTGEQRIVDTAGRIERFRRRYARTAPDAETSDSQEAPSTKDG